MLGFFFFLMFLEGGFWCWCGRSGSEDALAGCAVREGSVLRRLEYFLGTHWGRRVVLGSVMDCSGVDRFQY